MIGQNFLMKISQTKDVMEKLFTIKEVAKILKTNVNFVYSEKGKLPYVFIGSKKGEKNHIRLYEFISSSN